MSSRFGNKISIQIFGQSHSRGIGVVIDGLPPNEEIDLDKAAAFMARRAPGKSKYSTSRKEADIPEILSGIILGRTCGAPLCAVINNSDTRSHDYADLADIPRPSHADYPAHVKYQGARDIRGGGHFSGRLTAPLCFAGAVCLQLLERRGIYIGAHLSSVGLVSDSPFSPVDLTADRLCCAGHKEFPVLDDLAGERMKAEIDNARSACDSVGGIIECGIIGLSAGHGDPMFDGLENKLASALFGIPAVRGIEFGAGFQAASMRGSRHNDSYYFDKTGNVKTKTNHSGGILGGISTGMPILFRVAVKPTPSIAKEQDSVSLSKKVPVKLTVKGRHDPCIAPRAVPCVEAAAAAVILDVII